MLPLRNGTKKRMLFSIAMVGSSKKSRSSFSKNVWTFEKLANLILPFLPNSIGSIFGHSILLDGVELYMLQLFQTSNGYGHQELALVSNFLNAYWPKMTQIVPKGESEMTKTCVYWIFSKTMIFLPLILKILDFNKPNIHNYASIVSGSHLPTFCEALIDKN